MISKVSRRVRKKMKFGIHLPATYEESVRYIFPTMYLGADICKNHVNGDISVTECWAMSANSHVKKALEVV